MMLLSRFGIAALELHLVLWILVGVLGWEVFGPVVRR